MRYSLLIKAASVNPISHVSVPLLSLPFVELLTIIPTSLILSDSVSTPKVVQSIVCKDYTALHFIFTPFTSKDSGKLFQRGRENKILPDINRKLKLIDVNIAFELLHGFIGHCLQLLSFVSIIMMII
jgi:hypothetical protein